MVFDSRAVFTDAFSRDVTRHALTRTYDARGLRQFGSVRVRWGPRGAMGSSGDDGDANVIYALYVVVPISALLLFWFVASRFSV